MRKNSTVTFDPEIHCGAMGRQKGRLCCYRKGFRTDHPGEGRCFLHGGLSTGAKSEEGKRRVGRNTTTHGLYSTVLTGKDLVRLKKVREHNNGEVLQSNFEMIHAKLLGAVEGDVRLASRFQKLYGIAEVMAEQGEFDPEDLLDLKLRLGGVDLETITRVSTAAASLANTARSLSSEGDIRRQNNLLMNFVVQILTFSNERQIRELAVQAIESLKLEAGIPVEEVQELIGLVKDSVAMLEQGEEEEEAAIEVDFEPE